MLTFYRTADCPGCDEVAAQLQEQRLAHKVLQVENGALPAGESWPAGVPADAAPPILADGDAVFVGSEAIGKHLTQVARVKDRWQQHGSDACFCDPDGEIL